MQFFSVNRCLLLSSGQRNGVFGRNGDWREIYLGYCLSGNVEVILKDNTIEFMILLKVNDNLFKFFMNPLQKLINWHCIKYFIQT